MSCIIICFYAPNDHDYYTVEFNENQGFTNDEVDVPGHQLKHYEELDYHFICLLNTFQLSFFTNQDFLNRGRSTKKILFRSQKKMNCFFNCFIIISLPLFVSCLISVYKNVISIQQPFYCPLF